MRVYVGVQLGFELLVERLFLDVDQERLRHLMSTYEVVHLSEDLEGLRFLAEDFNLALVGDF